MLNGYVDVSVHDKLWAEVHIGLIGRQWDIILIEACYKGRLSYNMNIVKVGDSYIFFANFDSVMSFHPSSLKF